MRLNLKQVCQKYNYSESRVLKNFSEVSKAIKKKYGVDIIKVIIEDEIFYEIIGQERALTIYNEEHSIFIQFKFIEFSILYFSCYCNDAARGIQRQLERFFKVYGFKNQFEKYLEFEKSYFSISLERLYCF